MSLGVFILSSHNICIESIISELFVAIVNFSEGNYNLKGTNGLSKKDV